MITYTKDKKEKNDPTYVVVSQANKCRQISERFVLVELCKILRITGFHLKAKTLPDSACVDHARHRMQPILTKILGQCHQNPSPCHVKRTMKM